MFHTLYWKKVGLIMTSHNDLHDGVSNLTGKAFTPPYVQDSPLVHPGHSVREVKYHPTVPFHKILPRLERHWSRREIYWSTTSGREGWTVFTTWVLWTLKSSPTGTSRRRSVSRRRRSRIGKILWGLTPSTPPLLPLCCFCGQPPQRVGRGCA